MSHVLILGGAGYVGLALGQALVRSGNCIVFATTRDASKSNTLLSNEITPLVGNLSDADFIKTVIAKHRIDVVVDLSQAYADATTILNTVVEAAKARASALAADDSVGPKLGFIYTSGTWVNGSTRDHQVSDTTVPGTSLAVDKPATAVAWRPAHEQAVLRARDALDVAVLRPGAVYGRGSWVWGLYWSKVLAATQDGQSGEDIAIPADADTRTGVVHVDDIADAFVKAIGSMHNLGSWPVYDVVSETVSLTVVLEKVKRILGATGKLSYVGTHGDAFLEALALVTNASSARARIELGWTPKRREFVRDLPQLVAAWQASQPGQ
ncbi:hypothetical protein PFICI_03614 [Pestalotiopsis fici W106-1]|uniref:NAD-dependent epimerase/dehydratase domain-containing protein n=1 Tax=Pestalotiopsis fici (strain W106-1 / CGMCC3.15140) TaxID=1229662 RepID=W3XHW0_PESFW|nr:uncharacterized protein PFICI_03614 [Pestalotiopsis fici W106-1]ETS85589.1 hypothetical protein PFICI_03614 [Pestalotiopsis fici W106-1]